MTNIKVICLAIILLINIVVAEEEAVKNVDPVDQLLREPIRLRIADKLKELKRKSSSSVKPTVVVGDDLNNPIEESVSTSQVPKGENKVDDIKEENKVPVVELSTDASKKEEEKDKETKEPITAPIPIPKPTVVPEEVQVLEEQTPLMPIATTEATTTQPQTTQKIVDNEPTNTNIPVVKNETEKEFEMKVLELLNGLQTLMTDLLKLIA
jgi:outer membrane biosynthesis protein TonB